MPSVTERAHLSAPIALGGGGAVATPFQFLLTGEDGIRVTVLSRQINTRAVVRGRILRPGDSKVQAFSFEVRNDNPYEHTSEEFHLGECVILNAIAVSNEEFRGECYVRVDVIRGTGAKTPLGTLIAGYVGGWVSRSWPGDILETPIDGRGRLHTFAGATPAAATNPVLQCPTFTRWRVVAAKAILATSAVVANRTPLLGIKRDGGYVYFAPVNRVQVASETITYSWGAGVTPPVIAGANLASGGIPNDCYVFSEFSDADALELVTNLQVGDQWSALSAYVEEWREPASVIWD